MNIDPRGVYDSEGNIAVLGTQVRSSRLSFETTHGIQLIFLIQEGRDGYDAVEYIAACAWCTGAVGFAGNSWLAAAQWSVQAQPALLALYNVDVHFKLTILPGLLLRKNLPISRPLRLGKDSLTTIGIRWAGVASRILLFGTSARADTMVIPLKPILSDLMLKVR